MNDSQVRDLIRGQFLNTMIFWIMDDVKAYRYNVQQDGEVQRLPLLFDIIGDAVLLFWVVLLGGTMLLSILGLIMLVFNID